MTATTFTSALRKRTGTVVATLSNANVLVIANEAKNELARALVQIDASYFVVPVFANISASSATDLESREYPWNDDFMRQIGLQIATDSTQSPLKYFPAKPYPGGLEKLIDDIGGLTEANITANFSNEDGGAYYVQYRRVNFLLTATLSAVTNGYRQHYNAYPVDLTDATATTDLDLDPTTTTFGMPRFLHEIWVDLSSVKYKIERVNPLPLSAREQIVNQFWAQGRLSDLIAQAKITEDARQEHIGALPVYNYGKDY